MPRPAARPFAAALLSAAFLTLGAPAIAVQNDAKPTTNLGPTFVKGAPARYEVLNASRQIITVQGQQVSADITSTLGVTVEVTEITDEAAIVQVTIDTIESFIQSPQLFTEFSSKEPVENDGTSMIAPMMRPILGKTFTVTFTPDGATANAEGIDQLLPADPAQQQLIAQAIGAQGLAGSIAGIYVHKDGADALEEGATWSDVQQAAIPQLGVMAITSNATLESVSSESSKVILNGDATFTPDPNAAAMGLQTTIDEFTLSSEVTWDESSDMLRASTLKSTLMITVQQADSKQVIRIENESGARRLD